MWPRLLWSSLEGSHAGEDGSDDAFASVMEILRRRLGGRGAGGLAAAAGDDDDDGGGQGGAEDGGGGGRAAAAAAAAAAYNDRESGAAAAAAAAAADEAPPPRRSKSGWHPLKHKPGWQPRRSQAAKSKPIRVLSDGPTPLDVGPMPSACTRSSATSAAKGRWVIENKHST